MVKNQLLEKREVKQEMAAFGTDVKFSDTETDNIKLTQLAHTSYKAHRQSLRKNVSIEATTRTVWTQGKQYFNVVLQGYPKQLLKTLSPVYRDNFSVFYD